MGIYPNHGIEYIIRLNDNHDLDWRRTYEMFILEMSRHFQITNISYSKFFNCIILIPQKLTDDRLIKMKYYKNNESSWFHSANNYIKKLDDYDTEDLNLTTDETSMIDMAINLIKEYKNHGWYEVNYVYTTYE